MFFYRFHKPGLSINSYMVGDELTGDAFIIDPIRDISQIIALCHNKNIKVIGILETHVHADYISGAYELRMALKNRPDIYGSSMGGSNWIPDYVTKKVADGDQLICGNLQWQAIHTPGHTPEHLSWALFELPNREPSILFTGDFLFFGGIGRPDLLGRETLTELAENLYDSVFTVLPKFKDNVKIFPAHGQGSFCGKINSNKENSTLENERRENPFLQKKEKKVWIEEVLKEMPPPPQFFFRIKKKNLKKPLLLEELRKKIIEYKEIPKSELIILDPRSKEAFERSHFKKAVNIPYHINFSYWAALLLDEKKPILLIETEEMEQVIQDLFLIGIENIIGFIKEESFVKGDLESIKKITVDELKEEINSYRIIDVRSEVEWNEGHIEQAEHCPLDQINEYNEECKEKIAVICKSGFRANMAASILKLKGYEQVFNVIGGMDEWKKSEAESSFS